MSQNWDFNEYFATGNLCRDAELKYTAIGHAVMSCSIAVNGKPNQEGKSKVSFFDFTLWGKGAEALTKYLTKGKAIELKGHLEQNRWTAQDGKNMSRVIIVAERIRFQKGNKQVEKTGDTQQPTEDNYAPDETGNEGAFEDTPPDLF